MAEIKHKVFICYHHANDQAYKERLLLLNSWHDIFIDMSVDLGDIDDDLPDDTIREIIRDDFLMDSTVTIVLVGTETKYRKHIDWEIYSSMRNGKYNKQSGILVINLPSIECTYYTAAHGDDEKTVVYPDGNLTWTHITTRTEYERRYPYMPARIIDNLLASNAKVSVVDWDVISNDAEKIRFLINATWADRAQCSYDLSRPMRKANY